MQRVGPLVASLHGMNAKPAKSAMLAVTIALALVASLAQAKPKKPEPKGPSFDKAGAAAALESVELRKCLVPNAPRGDGHVMLTIQASGEISEAKVDQGPFVGTPVERCISGQFKKVKVPAFSGASITLGKAFAFGS
jgi:hypothetical protein